MLDLELLSSENLALISAEQPAVENTAMLYCTIPATAVDSAQNFFALHENISL